MFPSDWNMINDPAILAVIEDFATNQTSFHQSFSSAYKITTETGYKSSDLF